MDISILNAIREKISAADMILLGIGEELQIREDEAAKANPIYSAFQNEIEGLDSAESSFIKNSLYIDGLEKRNYKIFSEKLAIYHGLWELIKHKNYFTVTTCRDDVLYYSDFDSGKMTAPCGTRRLMKCQKGCQDKVLETKEHFEKLNRRLEQMYKEGFFDSDEIKKYIPVCEKCKAYMEMNFAGTEGYSETGYEKDWKRYMLWLQGTLNKNICILELGAGFAYPTVIRWPFEKIAMLNHKACFVRVNEKLPQTAKEIKEKSFSVEMNSQDFIAKITE